MGQAVDMERGDALHYPAQATPTIEVEVDAMRIDSGSLDLDSLFATRDRRIEVIGPNVQPGAQPIGPTRIEVMLDAVPLGERPPGNKTIEVLPGATTREMQHIEVGARRIDVEAE
jgi:hypothetical protein